MPALNVSLSENVNTAFLASAKQAGLRPADHASRILEDYLIENCLLSREDEQDVRLGRTLIERAVERALSLVKEEGFRPSITFDAIQSISSDPDWLRDYATLIRDDPYKTGSPRKQTINQNLGFYIKKALGAHSVEANNKPMNVKVKGSIIQSYTPLEIAR